MKSVTSTKFRKLRGVIFWLFYGILLHDKIIIIANIVTLALASTVLAIKIHNVLNR